MQCPPEVAELLLQILRTGILNVRTAANRGDSKRCFIEADHIHNLPSLLTKYSPDLLEYYWSAERDCYLRNSDGPGSFEPLWSQLEKYVSTR